MKYLAFDIEIAKSIPEGTTDWATLHPMGITCAATWASDEDKPLLWCGVSDTYYSFAPQMDKAHICRLVDCLDDYAQRGYRIVTVNGAGFDFRELAESSGRRADCKSINLQHTDCFFHIFCKLGYSPGLDAMSKGMGLPGKMKDLDGALAPDMWRNGDYGKVLSYVAQDSRQTLDLAMAVEAAGELRWTAKSGRPNSVKIPQWLTVKEALQLPEPDTSWMPDPWQRSKFTGWCQPVG